MPLAVLVSTIGRLGLVDIQKWWLIHAGLQSVGLVLVTIGVGIAMAEIDEHSGKSHWDTWHAKLGLTLVVLCWAQAIAGVIRPGSCFGTKDSMAHRIWSACHRVCGVGLLVGGIVNIFEGMELHNVEDLNVFLYAMAVAIFGCVIVLSYLFYWCDQREKDAAQQVEPAAIGIEPYANLESDVKVLESKERF